MADAKPRNILGPTEAAQASASEVVRRWDVACVLGGLVFCAVGAGTMAGLWALGEPTLGRLETLQAAGDAVNYLATMGNRGEGGWSRLWHNPGASLRLIVSSTLALAVSAVVFISAARPMSRVFHIDGPLLRAGKDALVVCKQLTSPETWAYLHPMLGMRKGQWTRHILISGGVGAGKTQILWGWIEQIVVKKNRKAIIYDTKGDVTAALPNALIISPWDARSAIWAIEDDITTPQAAEALAAAIIPTKEGEFWGPAARAVMVGVLHKLIHRKQYEGRSWGFQRFAHELTANPFEMQKTLAKYYAPGLRMLEDPKSTTALNVLQTINAHARVVSLLAEAWPDESDRPRFSLRAWAKDGYKGPRQVILQRGPDRGLTAQYIGAMLNTLVPFVTTPALKDAEMTRTLAFFLDEFPSIGRVDDIAEFMAVGRSKGCCVCLGFQSIEQIKGLYGNNFAATMQDLVGTIVVCKTAPGETQETVSKYFGKRRVAVVTHSLSAGKGGVTQTQHEEMRQTVMPSQLGEIGPVIKRKGFTIKAIAWLGGDPLLLEWPGKPLPKHRPGFIAAEWTKGVPKVQSAFRLPPEDDVEPEEGKEIASKIKDPLDKHVEQWRQMTFKRD